MKRSILGAAFVVALVLVSVAGAASPVVASPGVSPFSVGGSQPCGDNDMAAAQIAAGSTLYRDSEIEPRSTRFGSTIVGEYQQDRWDDGGARGLVTSVSHDNGLSWHRVVVPGITACSGGEYLRASDPWVSFGPAPAGNLYAISLSFFGNPDPNHNAILVSKSTNLGESWSDPVVLTEDNTNGLDKESITADPTNSSYVYAAWDRIITPGGSTHASGQGIIHSRSYKSQTFFTRSTNAGASWEAPQEIFVDSAFSGSIGSIVRVGSGTTLLDGLLTYGNAAWKGGPCGSISVLRSPDKGVSWEKKPVIVSPYSCTYVGAHNPDTGHLIRSGGLLDFATRGSNAYMVWEDALPSAPTRGVILFSQSTDNGVSWSTPIVISHTPASPGVDAFIPTIEINSAGTLGVSYYDFRSNVSGDSIASTDMWLTRCLSACSSAANWLADLRVTPTSFNMSAAPEARGEFLGDYMGMTTNGLLFEPFFIESGSTTQPPPVPTPPTDAFYASVP
jgi:hypothetical protein